MIALALVSILSIKDRTLALDREAVERLRHFFKHGAIVILPISFLIVFLSFWQTQEWTYWMDRLRIKIPFLLLPLVFVALPRFSKKQIQGLFLFMLLFFTLCNAFILYYYWQDYEQVIEMMKKGKPMWTPRDHIRYSLLLAWAIIGGIYLVREQYFSRFQWERLLIPILTLLAFFFIHFLSVKSGILVLYMGLLAWSLHYIVTARKFWVGLGILIFLVVAPVIAHRLFPTLQRKVAYTIHDFKMYAKGAGGDYSDAGRIASIEAGVRVGLKAPVLGVGAGNLRKEIHNHFDAVYPDYFEKLMPQNQFLFVWAGTGIWGLLLFSWAFAAPFFYPKNYAWDLFFVFYAMQFVTIMIEHAYENQVGVAHYLFFLLLLLRKK